MWLSKKMTKIYINIFVSDTFQKKLYHDDESYGFSDDRAVFNSIILNTFLMHAAEAERNWVGHLSTWPLVHYEILKINVIFYRFFGDALLIYYFIIV